MNPPRQKTAHQASGLDIGFRAELLRAIREYFFQQSVMEVITPTLRRFGVTDPNLDNVSLQAGGQEMFLQTSPEYAMKQLLAETGASIYQLCPAFRGGESGSRHRMEFQMLEWYRVGFDLQMLADDLEALLKHATQALSASFNISANISTAPIQRCSYRDLFMERLGVNPHQATIDDLKAQAQTCQASELNHLGEDALLEDYLDGLFATCVEPHLLAPTIVFDYPDCQAALAQLKVNAAGEQVADRFEFYAAGVEIANAYAELTDAEELRQRFLRHNQVRQERGQRQMPLDEGFLAAMPQMPDASGIALGMERLMMWLLGRGTLPQ